VSPSMELIHEPPPDDQVIITWIGHSTFLIQIDNKRVLTDPVWSDRCSPVQFSGPKRYKKVPIDIKDLPPIDFVCITHNHYDHLDHYVTQNLPPSVVWIVPKGLKSWFLRKGVKNVVELSWWDKFQYDEDTSVILTPCQHWSKRYLFGDTNTSLWGSYFIKSGKMGKRLKNIYFSGDTGYCDVFKETCALLGSVDIAFIPIGAYAPPEMMKPQHLDPSEAIKVHKDLQSKFSVGMHWGTFPLSPEPVFEPREKLRQEISNHNLDPNEFVTFNHGETRSVQIEQATDTNLSILPTDLSDTVREPDVLQV